MKYIVFVLLSFLSNYAFSQQDNLIGSWTNGFESYGSTSYNDSLMIFNGGNLHEGGSVFTVKVVSDSKFIITGREPYDNCDLGIGEIGDDIGFQVVNDIKVLIIKNANGEMQDLLRLMEQYETLEDLYI